MNFNKQMSTKKTSFQRKFFGLKISFFTLILSIALPSMASVDFIRGEQFNQETQERTYRFALNAVGADYSSYIYKECERDGKKYFSSATITLGPKDFEKIKNSIIQKNWSTLIPVQIAVTTQTWDPFSFSCEEKFVPVSIQIPAVVFYANTIEEAYLPKDTQINYSQKSLKDMSQGVVKVSKIENVEQSYLKVNHVLSQNKLELVLKWFTKLAAKMAEATDQDEFAFEDPYGEDEPQNEEGISFFNTKNEKHYTLKAATLIVAKKENKEDQEQKLSIFPESSVIKLLLDLDGHLDIHLEFQI